MLRQLFRAVSLIVAGLCIAMAGAAQQVSAPEPQPATLTGTVLGADGGVVPGAKVVLDGTGADDRQTVVSGDDGSFQFANVRPGVSWRVTISATSFGDWTSNPITLSAGQHFILTGIQLRLATVKVSVNAITPEQAAAEQVRAQETQRVFGIVPNFYVVYERNHAPLTPKLKFQLAFKALNDPVSLTGFALNAGIYQMVGYPGYRGGMAGYGQRLGATFAGAYTHVLVADAVLASLLHQDPRYFYQGTGTTRSRLLHALSQAVFTTGDDGHREINYSGIGGDLVSGAVANAYYPPGDRGGALVVRSALIGMGGRVTYAVAQEFLLNKHTSRRGGP